MKRFSSSSLRKQVASPLGGCVTASVLAFALGACTGNISDTMSEPTGGTGTSTGSTTGGGTPTGAGTGGTSTGTAPIDPNTNLPADPSRVAIHRLNNVEYDNTMRDLLGVPTTPAATFIDDEKAYGFDNIADAFTMSDARFEQYFNAADTLVETAFADPTLRGNILTCTPTGPTDTTCMGKIINAFGLRAWRRPLVDTEVTRLTQVMTDAIGFGETPADAVKQGVKAMLSSVPFLYRIEIDAEPASAVKHRLSGYELASRLSYLAWSSMPDQTLFDAAQNNTLLEDATLTAQLDRLLADPARGKAFATNFAGQWLGLRDMASHQVEPTVFTTFTDPLRQAMIQEGSLFFQEFLTARNMKDFFTTDVNFVNKTLGTFYGMTGSTTDAPMKVTNTTDTRVGFMGLGAFLTFTSFSYRTAPTLRGKWVLENLLCEELQPPPPGVPKLDDATAAPTMLQSENVRVRLETHRANPMCAACHKTLDPIGMGLENFDAIGAFRTKYANGDTIDSSGELPDGSKFTTVAQLATILAKPEDTRLTDCAAQKLMTYALSRGLDLVVDPGAGKKATDLPYLTQVKTAWGGTNINALLKQIVLNDTFRFRRGETM